MKPPIKKFQIVGLKLGLNDDYGVCFNAVRSIFLEIIGYIQTDIHTDIQICIQKVRFII